MDKVSFRLSLEDVSELLVVASIVLQTPRVTLVVTSQPDKSQFVTVAGDRVQLARAKCCIETVGLSRRILPSPK